MPLPGKSLYWHTMNQVRPKKIAIQTIGCRLNQYESERIVTQLAPYGFKRAMPDERVDLYIVNTCTVTHRADSSCRNLIRRAARNNPDGRIVVIGCYVDAQPELISGMEGVDLIIGNEHKEDIGRILNEDPIAINKSHSTPSSSASSTNS